MFHTGAKSAYLGGGNGRTHTVRQSLTIPIAAPTGQSNLGFYRYITSEEPSTTPYDSLRVDIKNPLGQCFTLQTFSNASEYSDWLFTSLSVGPYIGSGLTVEIRFEATTDSSYPTHFYIDDVALYACDGY